MGLSLHVLSGTTKKIQLFFAWLVFMCEVRPVGSSSERCYQSIPGGFGVTAPSYFGSGYLRRQPSEARFQAVAGHSAAGDHVTRSLSLATARTDRADEPAQVGGRRRPVGLVGEDEQREARSAPDQRSVAEQSPQLSESDRKSRRVGTVDNVHDPVALAQIVRPQVPVATLQQPGKLSLSTRKLRN